MTDNKRIKECKRKVIAAINEAKLPFAVTELILENVLDRRAREHGSGRSSGGKHRNSENRGRKKCRIKALRRKTNETGNAICAAG